MEKTKSIEPGTVFELLTVVEELKDRDKRGNILYRCRCECGNEKNVRKDGLLGKNNRSCGCLLREQDQFAPGSVFGRLTVIKRAQHTSPRLAILYECQCACGAVVDIVKGELARGSTQSCGCYRKDVAAERGRAKKTHGKTGTVEFHAWQSAIERCHNPTGKDWSRYGERGIVVCQAWRDSFETFLKDMGLKPDPKTSLDRIDVNGNYEPSNCRWATATEQARNKRNNVVLEWRGETKLLIEWCEELCLNAHTVYARIYDHGWDVERAFSTPIREWKKRPVQSV